MFLLKPRRPHSARPAAGTCSGGSCLQADGSPYSLSPRPCFPALLSVSQEGKARGDGKAWAPRGDLSDRPLIKAVAWGSHWCKVVRTGKPQLLIQTAMETSPHSSPGVVQMLVERQGSQLQGSQHQGCRESQHGAGWVSVSGVPGVPVQGVAAWRGVSVPGIPGVPGVPAPGVPAVPVAGIPAAGVSGVPTPRVPARGPWPPLWLAPCGWLGAGLHPPFGPSS